MFVASFVSALGVEEVDGITWSSVWGFGGLCAEKQCNIWWYMRERKEKQRIPMIVIVHTVVIIIKCQYDCRSCCSEAWCTCTMLSTSKLRGDAITRDFTSLSCWINSGDIFSRIHISWSVAMEIFSGTYRWSVLRVASEVLCSSGSVCIWVVETEHLVALVITPFPESISV